MTAVLSLLIIVTFAIFVTRMASSALMLTGLSFDIARFQARSAFTGCGFTTQEAEDMVRHPVRRRIIMLLMLLGNAGLVTAISSLLLSFVNLTEAEAEAGTAWLRGCVIAIGLVAIWLLARSRWPGRFLIPSFDAGTSRYSIAASTATWALLRSLESVIATTNINAAKQQPTIVCFFIANLQYIFPRQGGC